MQAHSFIFTPGYWLGSGTINFSLASAEVKFFTKWTIAEAKDNSISCTQRVEIEGGGDQVVNLLTFSNLSPTKFAVGLENAMIGAVSGTGIVDDKTISWEFRNPEEGFEGFEIYERQGEDEYLMRGEYASDEQTRTIIEGKIWKSKEEAEE